MFRFLAGAAAFFYGLAVAAFTAHLVATHLFRCAPAIRSRDAALSFRLAGFLAGAVVVRPCEPASKARAC